MFKDGPRERFAKVREDGSKGIKSRTTLFFEVQQAYSLGMWLRSEMARNEQALSLDMNECEFFSHDQMSR